MSEPSAIWMFFSILAICFTWHKIASSKATPAENASFLLDGKPFDGNIEITRAGKTTRLRIVNGRIDL